MDPDLIFSRYRDDAFASQLTANEYSTFVAMPFRDRFSYRAGLVYSEVIQAAGTRANELLDREPRPSRGRRFAMPRRVDDGPMTAKDIGGEIAKAILYAHVVVADLTFANDGVLLEVGASLALKPTSQIVLITQGRPDELHFDIKGNTVVSYSAKDGVDKIAIAMIAAAESFEQRRAEYLTNLSRELSPDAVRLMNWYGRARTGTLFNSNGVYVARHLDEEVGIRLFTEGLGDEAKSGSASEAMIRYQMAARDLITQRLLWNDYRSQTPAPGTDTHCVRGTQLGWMFISQLWPDLKRPEDEFSGNAR